MGSWGDSDESLNPNHNPDFVTMPRAPGLMQTRPLSATPGPSAPTHPPQPASLPVHPGMTKAWWPLTSLGPWAGSSQGLSGFWPLSPPCVGRGVTPQSGP